MMFFSMTSLYNGAGGRSSPRLRNGMRSTTSCTWPVAALSAAALPAKPTKCLIARSDDAG